MTKRLVLCFLLLTCRWSVLAQTQTPAQVYLAYRAAFEHATSLDAVRPFMAATVLVKVDALPVPERPKVLDSLKLLNSAYQVHVIAEADMPDGHVLIVEGVDGGDKPIRGSVDLVKEAGNWKITKETWHGR